MATLPAEYIDIRELVLDDAWPQLRKLFAASHPADIADLIDRAPRDSHARLFQLIDEERQPDVLAELDPEAGHAILSALTTEEISELVEEMAPDDAADLLGDLPEHRSDEVLDLMEEEESEDVRKLMEYPEDSAGGIMTTKVVAMKANQSVQEAIAAIADLDESEPFVYAYIVDDNNRLTGVVDIWELLREKNKERALSDIGHSSAAAHAQDDQEEVAHMMSQYDLSAIPVVDDQGCLIGRITSDDVIDVIKEEATEDILRMAGLDDAAFEARSPLHDASIRLPWLFITLGGGVLTALILNAFRQYTSQIGILGIFVPAILAMGGNTGIQASTLMVRSIALNGGGRGRDLTRILGREIGTGALMGVVCGLLIGLWAHFLASREAASMLLPPLQLASIVATALFSAMTFAAVFGAVVPLILDRSRIDPAVAAGPFVSIANDISALLIYFAVTVGMLHSFSG
jgi:magnesium transporter